ncbi:MAG: class I SAM-dependent methyltransferase [bacterium]|nr:class I SAM-dependent methyltransferase [bacterium]
MATQAGTAPSSSPRVTAPRGVHLVGSLPLTSAEEVFRTAAEGLGDRLRRIPDGETGPRADWIVWQYPVLSSRPEFEVGPPDLAHHYRALPRLKLRPGEDGRDLRFDSLGYADAARASYRTFARLKRDGVIPKRCRFQVSLPTPLAPISAFVALGDQDVVEQPYERRMLTELDEIVAAIPPEQLAIQWDTNFEFGMLEGVYPVWFNDVKGGILERLLRISRRVPPGVELGYHLCYGDPRDPHHQEAKDAGHLAEIASALAVSLGRTLNWVHVPIPAEAGASFFEPLRHLRLQPETELYLGLVHHADGEEGARRRIGLAQDAVGTFGVATACGLGRHAPAAVHEVLRVHAAVSEPLEELPSDRQEPFTWPAGVARIPDEEWVTQPLDTFGMQYDTVENHGWYRNLDPTIEQLAAHLDEGDVLLDYSGGTGILLNRLRLRIFDRQIGMLIVDSSAKFLRVALEHFRDDPRVALRLIRWVKDQKRLQYVDEVMEPALLERGVDVLASTNAIHLYTDLGDTLRSWARVLKPGGLVFINSGNVRNPSARPNEWILDETVYVIHEVATGLVRTDPRYAAYRDALDDDARMAKHLAVRDRVFVAPRPLSFYLEELAAAGLEVEEVTDTTIDANVDEWYELMCTYHEPVLGWVGGSEKVDGHAPSEQAVQDRLALIRHSMDVLFGGRKDFRCCWTYLRCRNRTG